LHQVFVQHLPEFLAEADDCPQCGFERLVAWSCKGRGFCPSCGGRRMADTAAHVVDHIVPNPTPLHHEPGLNCNSDN